MDLAFTIDAPYLPWCAVAIRSCLDHYDDDVTVHLVHEGSLRDDAGLALLAGMVEGAGGILKVHAVDPDGLPNVGMGKVVWLRCLLPELLSGAERVVFIDADTLATSSLRPLHETDLGGAPLAAVANVVQPSQRDRIRALGIEDYRRYFAAGMMVLDLERLRAEDATTMLLGLAETRGDELLWADMDALNLLFQGRWHALHPRWDAPYTLWTSPEVAADVYGEEAATEARRDPAILHFEGPSLCKPWHALNTHPWRRAWWATLARTPWAGARAEDRGAATTALRFVPERLRIRAYGRLVRWRREHRTAAS